MRKSLWIVPVALAAGAHAETVVLTQGNGVKVPGNARTAVRRDPVEAALLKLKDADSYDFARLKWEPVSADKEGVFSGPFTEGGYVWVRYDSLVEKTAFLEAEGSSVSYVNWIPRVGDPYSFGCVSLPVRLRKGRNDFLFACGRGRLRARLIDAEPRVSLDLRDATWPSAPDKPGPDRVWGGVVVRNATDRAATCSLTDQVGPRTGRTAPFVVPPMGFRKVPVALVAGGAEHQLTLRSEYGDQTTTVKLPKWEPGAHHRVTFLSQVDGSVQYFAVNPSSSSRAGQALLLSLHGASVEAIGQAQAYGPRDWANLVAPTNRRPFGFDWEEVGRLDALEVLAHAREQFQPDRNQVYLTGHSMGGHGTWSLGSLFPDRFAGLMPSAGWVAFSTYAGGARYEPTDPLQAILARANNVYETGLRAPNLLGVPVYVLHGSADDNVPVDQARQMTGLLKGHRNLVSYEEEGAGHWWDKDPRPGADCVDWAPGFDFLRKSSRNEAALRVRFTTPDPWVSGTNYWVRLGEQQEALTMSSVDLAVADKVVRGSTQNLASFVLTLPELDFAEVDGQTVPLNGPGPYGLSRRGGRWRACPPSEVVAVPRGVKSVFDNHVRFVVGTGGTNAEQAATWELAQYWAETYWYRGNAGIDLVTDLEAERDGLAGSGGPNLVLFGRPDTNRLWKTLDSQFGVKLSRRSLRADGKVEDGDDLAVLALAPLGGRRVALGVGGTGVTGLRLAARTPVFTSGAAYPDMLAWRPSMLSGGASGVVMAGFLSGPRTPGQIVWRK